MVTQNIVKEKRYVVKSLGQLSAKRKKKLITVQNKTSSLVTQTPKVWNQWNQYILIRLPCRSLTTEICLSPFEDSGFIVSKSTHILTKMSDTENK